MLNYVKDYVGVIDTTNFDTELLGVLGSITFVLVQLGVDEFDGLVIDSSTEWPSTLGVHLTNMVREYIGLGVKINFDPSASATISAVLNRRHDMLGDRIRHYLETTMMEV